MKRLILAISTAFLATSVLPVSAATVPQREKKQEHRIERGVRSGKLTPKEQVRIHNQQAIIDAERAQAKQDGKITHRERADMQHDLNRLSKDIHRKKYNNKKVHYHGYWRPPHHHHR